MERKVSNKIYQFSLYVVALFVILNIIGIWVLWCCNGSAFGYVTGALLLASLILSGCLAFFNEKPAVRKQWILWLICLCVHLLFFILTCTLWDNDNSYTIPALFTVMDVAIGGAVGYFIVKNRLIMKSKPYVLNPTVPNEGTSQDSKGDGDIVQRTIKINVDQDVDKTPVANFKPTDDKKVEEKKEESPAEPTGVITL